MEEKIKGTIIVSKILKWSRRFLEEEGFIEILPLILTKLSDPLLSMNYAKTKIKGKEYLLTTSMIFQKQILMNSFDKIFIISPNIRIENKSVHHLIEFVQIDVEIRNAKREDVLSLIENLLIYIISNTKKEIPEIVKVPVPDKPFKRITFLEMKEKFGDVIKFSKNIEEPYFLIDFPEHEREFYDKEDPERRGILLDYDLIYPYGFGEGLSGGEREYEYEKILERIKRKGMLLEIFKEYLEYAKRGFYPSAGFGLGVERLARYLGGFDDIIKTRIFVY
ncbi:MAG: asparagine synthetase A [candidate division WOR-3 bacterium]